MTAQRYQPSLPAWAGPYIGIPFADKGRTMEAADCYGIGKLIFKRELGIELPDVQDYDGTGPEDAEHITALMNAARESGDWIKVPFNKGAARSEWPERPFDIIEIRVEGFPDHIGVVAEPGVAIETRDTPSGCRALYYREQLWGNVILGFRRHRLLLNR